MKNDQREIISATKELIVVELKLFWREPIAVFFTLVFPFFPLLIFGTVFGGIRAMPGFRVIDLYVPAILAMVMSYLGLMGIPIAISEYREQGVLKRYWVSPMRLGTFLLAHIVVQFSLFLVAAFLIVIVAELVFDIRFVGNPALVALAIVISSASLFTVGFALVGLCSSPRTTQAVGSAVFFIMLFTSGAAIPRRQFPAWMRELTDFVPLTHVVDSLTGLWIGKPLHEQYAAFAILIALAIAAFLVATATFKWSD